MMTFNHFGFGSLLLMIPMILMLCFVGLQVLHVQEHTTHPSSPSRVLAKLFRSKNDPYNSISSSSSISYPCKFIHTMPAGSQLERNEYLCSPNHEYQLGLLDDPFLFQGVILKNVKLTTNKQMDQSKYPISDDSYANANTNTNTNIVWSLPSESTKMTGNKIIKGHRYKKRRKKKIQLNSFSTSTTVTTTKTSSSSSSSSSDAMTTKLRLQRDGNLVLYGGGYNNSVIWSSNTQIKKTLTNKREFMELILDNEGVLYIKTMRDEILFQKLPNINQGMDSCPALSSLSLSLSLPLSSHSSKQKDIIKNIDFYYMDETPKQTPIPNQIHKTYLERFNANMNKKIRYRKPRPSLQYQNTKNKANTHYLIPDYSLYPGDYISSPNGKYRLGFFVGSYCREWTQNKSNIRHFNIHLSICERGKRKPNVVLWFDKISTNIYFTMKSNGDLLLRHLNDQSICVSSTKCNNRSNMNSTFFLILRNDGIATVTDIDGLHHWSSSACTMCFQNAKNAKLVKMNNVIVDPTSLYGKIMAGYQGWFGASNDNGIDQWKHWSRKGKKPSPDTITFDIWPDLREYTMEYNELYPTNLFYANGTNAPLYSANNAFTIQRHLRWMQEYNLDGVFVQRFIHEVVKQGKLFCFRDKVLHNVRGSAEKYGRVFANMYDISGAFDMMEAKTLITSIQNDWMHLVDDLKITKSKSYIHHHGKPVLGLWGFGFSTRPYRPEEIQVALDLIDWFQNKADMPYRVTLLGGVPAGWRNLGHSSKKDPGWAEVFRKFDIISPWTVGRIKDNMQRYRNNFLNEDLRECDTFGIDYMPVVFPGFSMHNLKPNIKTFNEVPRRGGRFFWDQFYNAIEAGSKMIYIAMFDEVDEGTAIFKLAETVDQIPVNAKLLTLNDDDTGSKYIPSDWYLQLVSHASRYISNRKPIPFLMPSLP